MDHGECWNPAFPPALLGCWRFLLWEARGELLVFVSGFSWDLEAETEPRSTKVREQQWWRPVDGSSQLGTQELLLDICSCSSIAAACK